MERQWRRILHPTDFSAVSEAAFIHAARLGRQHDAELFLLHVLVRPTPYEIQAVGWHGLHEAAEVERGHDAQAQLDALVERATQTGTRAISLLVDGVPHRRIVHTATSMRADLIVMGTHAWSGLSRLLFGSTAVQVIRAAECPVLTVRVPSAKAPLHSKPFHLHADLTTGLRRTPTSGFVVG